MHAGSRLVAIEQNPALYDVLRQRVAGAVLGDVAELATILDRCGVERVDLVLSGLPVPSLPRAVNAAVLERLAAEPAVRFSQLTVMPWVYRSLYRRLFCEVEFRLVAANLPPGGVYHCRGLRDDFRCHIPGQCPPRRAGACRYRVAPTPAERAGCCRQHQPRGAIDLSSPTGINQP